MNLHVTSDSYGLFPKQIAMRIKRDGINGVNKMVNLGETSIIHDEIITYISTSSQSIKKFIASIDTIDKIIFHPYNFSCYNFLKIALIKYPEVKVYWAFWSSELYSLDHLPIKHFKPFAETYVNENKSFSKKIKDHKVLGNFMEKVSYAIGLRKNYIKILVDSFKQIDFFCSFLPSDFLFFQEISPHKTTKYLPFAYLSIDDIIENPDDFVCMPGNKVMIGHSSSPLGNHYEIIQQLSDIDPNFCVFLPLAYGDKNYGDLIEHAAQKKFATPEVQRLKLDSVTYSKKLMEVGWAIINTKVQQGLGNIITLLFMGAKVFLDKDSTTYKDFTDWGIVVFTVQDDINLREMSNKLSEEQMNSNRKIISTKCDTGLVKQYWKAILS